jgi:membrane protein YdbS with pleckstrin-like domain
MNNDQKKGMSCIEVLTLVFVVLKLIGVINWSWWWVVSPLWIPVGFIIAYLLIGLIVAGIIKLSSK